MRQLDSLTITRFFAALYVVLYHFSARVLPVWDRVGPGTLGVALFFVLSGFILMYKYGERATTDLGFYRSFLIARFARIYPAFLLASVLAAPFAITNAFQRHVMSQAFLKSTIAGIATLSLTHAWHPRLAFFWNFPSWSVSVEAFFYVCFPALAVWFMRLDRRRRTGVATACVLVSPQLLVFLIATYFSYHVDTIPVLHLSEFLLGMATGRVFLITQNRCPLNPVYGVAATILAILTVAFLPRLPLAATLLLPSPVFAFLIYILGRCERPSPKRHPFAIASILILLGDASYSIYILQWPLFRLTGLSAATVTTTELIAYLGLLFAVSIVSLKLVETPLRRRIVTLGWRTEAPPRQAVAHVNS